MAMGAPLQRKRQRPRDPEDPSRIKVLVLGDESVGKTSMLKRFCEAEELNPGYRPTVGVDHFQKPMSGKSGRPVKLHIWDTSGSAEFFDIRAEFYKESHAVLLMMDTSNRRTFDSLDAVWLREAVKCGGQDLTFIVVGGKADLRAQRAVREQQAKDWALGKGFPYFEVSSADGTGIEDLWKHVVQKMQ